MQVVPRGSAAMTDDETLIRVPRLTRLEVQGFKSFRNRTIFAFEQGITAVVGPNGSGKSNVADAVRWVLGEQGQFALRARRTDEIIFSGGQGRPPAGIAEATLTFDNSEGWLPIAFSEVAITRRAYRSGENQYLINGRKVRLKDVALLTAGLGQSHVVVGQGLVDAALSLRAEERRGLFEHAADLTGLRLKIAEAERNLAETDTNTTRLRDLLAEMEPRLKSLERSARQAKEWQGIRDRLRELQLAHYRAAIETARQAVSSAQCTMDAARAAAVAAHDEVSRLELANTEAATYVATLRERLATLEQQSRSAEDLLRRWRHEHDLAGARIDALAKRRADMDDARLGLDEQASSVAIDLGKLAVDLRELERTTTEARHELARLNTAKTGQEESRRAVATRLAAAKAELAAGDRQQTDLLRRRAALTGRQEALAAERERLQGALDDLRKRVSGLQGDLDTVTAVCAEDEARLSALQERLAGLAVDVVKTGRASAAIRVELDTLQDRRGDAATRLQALRRLQESGAGLFSGVREVLTAGRDGRLNGVLGTVAELIVVPESFELAIESALGSHLQDIVVDAWQDAEAAIAHLKHTGVGRATFQPLDTVRGGNGQPVSQTLRQLDGVRGVAADLVTASPPLTPVRTALLGHTVVVDSLTTARAALALLAPGWNVVTEAGDIARSGGSVTGGSPVRDSGTLARERELRDLPTTIIALEKSLVTTRQILADAEAAANEAQREHQQATTDRATLLAAASERCRQRDRTSQWLDTIVAEQARDQQRQRALCSDLEGVQHEQDEVEDSLDHLQALRATAVRAHDEAEASLVTLTSATSELERAAAEEGRRLAGLEERLRAERRREASLRAQERALAEELSLRDERTSLLERERETTVAEQVRLSDQIGATSADHDAIVAELEPLRAEVTESANSAQRLATSLQTAQGVAIDRRRESDQAEFALERARQDLAVLLQRVRDDLDVVDVEELFENEPGSIEIPEAAREAEIARLRERLRRVGYVGEDAVATYEREAEHQAFLREQLADVEGAAAALRELIADLRQTMRTRFDETFARVAAAFAESFSVLFGGGTARLMLSTSDNGSEPGIEIVAQPPGKRLQNLALLSGGERALTAAALLFAILQVNPVPFCLLDEVDAALDEANVVRFREELQKLAAHTQVIVVTHNRVTIEIADTLYGVSMGADGVSQVLSLRLSEALPAD